MQSEMAANLDLEWEKGRDRLSASLREQLERGRAVPALEYQQALARIALLNEAFDEMFARYDALLTPAAAGHRARRAWRRPATRRSARCGRCAACRRSACR